MTKSFTTLFLSSMLTLLSFFSFSQSQRLKISGNIYTKEGKPAIFVSVELVNIRKKTVADAKGYFLLDSLLSINDTILITGPEFLPYKQPVNLSNLQSIYIENIKLEYNISVLQEVEIIGRGSQSYKSDYSFAGNKVQTSVKDIPQSVSSITKELIADKMAIRLYNVLDNIAGVNDYSGYNEYTIRGFRAENPNLINGLRTFNTSLTSPMLTNIERIEVIKGPVSVLYGNADPGGTINLVTKKPLTQKEYRVDIFKGSWKNIRAQADITGPLNKTKTLLYRFDAGLENSNSFRNQLFSKSLQLAPSFSFVPNDRLKLNLDFSLSNTHSIADRGQPGLENNIDLASTQYSLNVSQPKDYIKETNISSILSLSYKINNYISFNSAYLNYVTRQSLSEHSFDDYITEDSISLKYTNRQINTVTNNLTNYLIFKFNTGKFSHQLLAGYDFIKSSVNHSQWEGELPDEFGIGSGIVGGFSLIHPLYFARPIANYQHKEENPDEEEEDAVDADEYYTNGIYIQEQLTYKKWQVLASLRGEFYTGIGDDYFKQQTLLPRVGVTYSVSKNMHVYATYNKGFDPFEVATSLQIFDAPFKPIHSTMYEVGTKTELLRNRVFATLAFYQITLKNVAVNANDPSNPDLFVQRGQERARGFETELNGNILSNLSVSFSYAYNVAKIIKSEKPDEIGAIKENAPKHTSGSHIKYIISKGFIKGLGISVGHSQAGVRNTLQENFRLPAYCIFNTSIQYNRKHINIAFNLNNIGNSRYWSAAYNSINKWPGATRNYMVRLGYSF